ncbi:MAG: DUF541 domain-containing protein [Dehalococcoidia bacterium]|nr:DUF541 domain-containing protein [Dehalococcoidia bacterium]
MKIFAVLAALTLPLALVACGGGDDVTNVSVQPPGTPSGINVDGEGIVTIEPDLATLNLGVEVRAASADEALVLANGAFDNLSQVLTDQGVAEEDIQTTGISIQPEYNFDGDPPTIIGFIASNTVNVMVRDLDSTGDVIDGVTSAAGDATRINQITFEREDDAEAISQARDLAVEDARQKAESLADGAGIALGDLVSITDVSFSEPPPTPFNLEAAASSAGDDGRVATPVSPGTLEVRVSVAAVYDIAD